MTERLDADHIASPFRGHRHHEHAYFIQLERKLRWQLLLAYLTPLVLLSAYFHYQYTDTLRQGIYTHLKSVAENKRNTVSLFLQERIANTRSAFTFEGLSTIPTADEMQQALAELRRESSTFVDLGLFDPAGSLVAYAGPFPTLRGRNYSQEEWFRTLGQHRRPYYLSDVFMGFRGRAHFIIAVRKEVGGKPWTLRASVDPERFAEFVGSAIQMQNVEAFIVNRKGQRQTPSRGHRLFQTDDHVPNPSQETTVDEVEVAGQLYLSAYAWIAETGWALVVRIPTAIANAPVHRARIILASIAVLTLGLVIILVIRRTKKIISKLEAVDQAREDLTLQLFNAAKLASVGEMAAGVAHEINNPLAIIYEEAGLMKDALDPQFAHEFNREEFLDSLDAIMEATLRGRSITSKLMAFARKHDADPEATDLNLLLEKVLSIKDHELRVSNIEVRQELSEELPDVLVNPNQMEQVLLNLINNAMDAINDSGRITLRTRLENGKVGIEVEDTGCGMTADQMAKIFFPFFTTKAVGKGTGLGLSISYGIIKALGGSIEVASEAGVGSTFSITLPVARSTKRSETSKNQRQRM